MRESFNNFISGLSLIGASAPSPSNPASKAAADQAKLANAKPGTVVLRPVYRNGVLVGCYRSVVGSPSSTRWIAAPNNPAADRARESYESYMRYVETYKKTHPGQAVPLLSANLDSIVRHNYYSKIKGHDFSVSFGSIVDSPPFGDAEAPGKFGDLDDDNLHVVNNTTNFVYVGNRTDLPYLKGTNLEPGQQFRGGDLNYALFGMATKSIHIASPSAEMVSAAFNVSTGDFAQVRPSITWTRVGSNFYSYASKEGL